MPNLPNIPTVSDIAALQDQLTTRWHQEAFEVWRPPADAWTSLVARQHLANFELWHTEDAARTPGATDAELARVKRRIDETNQRRNDLSEQIDLALLERRLAPSLPACGKSSTPESKAGRSSDLAIRSAAGPLRSVAP